MAVTMSQVLAELDKDEPNYSAAASLGPDALPHLRQITEAADVMRASKATYLAGLIGGAQATSIVEQAIAHNDPIVRVAAAHAFGSGLDAPAPLLERLLDDADVGVRKLAVRAARKTPGRKTLKGKISKMASDDPDPNIRAAAGDVAREL